MAILDVDIGSDSATKVARIRQLLSWTNAISVPLVCFVAVCAAELSLDTVQQTKSDNTIQCQIEHSMLNSLDKLRLWLIKLLALSCIAGTLRIVASHSGSENSYVGPNSNLHVFSRVSKWSSVEPVGQLAVR